MFRFCEITIFSGEMALSESCRIWYPDNVRSALHSRHNNHIVVTLYEIISKNATDELHITPFTLSERLLCVAIYLVPEIIKCPGDR